jgi:hypothetical protein
VQRTATKGDFAGKVLLQTVAEKDAGMGVVFPKMGSHNQHKIGNPVFPGRKDLVQALPEKQTLCPWGGDNG